MATPTQTVAVIGMGAVGTVLAAHLRASGHRVLAYVRRAPQRPVVSVSGAQAIPPTELEWVTPENRVSVAPDVVVIATKILHTREAWQRVANAVTEDTSIVLAQNGVDHASRLSDSSALPVIPALVFFNAERKDSGDAKVHSGHRVMLPETAEAQRVAKLFSTDGLHVETSRSFREDAWRKLLVNLTNPLTALTAQRMRVFSNPQMLGLLEELLQETVEVAAAEGVGLTAQDIGQTLNLVQAAPSDVIPSMLQDRLSDRPMEHEGLFAPVREAAQRHGVPIPRLDTVMALLAGTEL